MDIVNQVEQAVIDTRTFTLIGAADAPIKTTFKFDEISCEPTILDEWRVQINAKNIFEMHLFLEDELRFVLRLSKSVWSGRDMISGRRVELRPEAHHDRWEQIAKPSFIQRHMRNVSEEVNYKYIETMPQPLDASQFEYDITKQISHKSSAYADFRSAISIVACDRPSYFMQTIKSLSECTNIDNFPIFIFLDFPDAPNAASLQKEHMGLADYFLPKATIIRRRVNFGCGRNLIDARRQLFDKMGYDRVFVFEDDMVVSKSYLEFCMSMLDWAESNYSNVGAVQGWNMCQFSQKGKEKYLDHVYPSTLNWWGYLMTQKCWQSIKDYVYQFEKLFLRWKYSQRPHRSVLKWFQETLVVSDIHQNFYPVDAAYLDSVQKFLNSPPSGQDAATMIALHKKGYVRLVPFVNRSQYIGQQGIHMQPSWFARDGYDKVLLHEYATDRKIKSFTCGSRAEQDEKDKEIVPGVTYMKV